MRLSKILIVAYFAIIYLVQGYGQDTIRISPNPALDFDSDCIEIEMGDRLIFVRESPCGPDLLISPDRGNTIVFRSSKAVVPYVFEEIGEFSIFCNGPAESAVITACVNAIDPSLGGLDGNVIPTVGEWGIINLLLLMLICTILSYKKIVFPKSLLHK